MQKGTSAQQAIVHLVLSLAISALLTIAAAVYQFSLNHGLDVQGLAQFIGPVFLGQLSLIWMALRTNPSLAQAESDTGKELAQKVESMLPFLHTHAEPIAAPAQQQNVAPVQAPAPGTPALSLPTLDRGWTAMELPTVQQPAQ